MGLQGLNGNLTDLGKMCSTGWKCHFCLLSGNTKICSSFEFLVYYFVGNLLKKILFLQMLQLSGLMTHQVIHIFEVLKT